MNFNLASLLGDCSLEFCMFIIWFSLLFLLIPVFVFRNLTASSSLDPTMPVSPCSRFPRRRRRRIHPLVRRGLRKSRHVLLRKFAKAAASPTWAADVNSAPGYLSDDSNQDASASLAPIAALPCPTVIVDELLDRLDPIAWRRRLCA